MNVSSIKNDVTSKFVEIATKPEYETLLYFISNFFHSNRGSGCSEVVGVVGDIDSKTASILHTLASRSNLTLTIVSFIDEWRWSRVGLIRDDTLYYQYAAEMLHTKLTEASKTITPNFVVSEVGINIHHVLNQVSEYGTYIFVLSLRRETALSLLKEAQELGFSWPEYAWIVLSINSDPDTFADYVEGTFVTRDYSGIEMNNIARFFCSNSGNQSLDTSLPGIVKFREGKILSNISVVQLVNSSENELEIVYYEPELKQLNVIHNLSASGNIPHGTTVILEFVDSTARIATILVAFTSIVVLVTTILACYIYFRNEPKIKATSVSVSLSMFLGCYLELLFVPFLLIESQPDGFLGHNGGSFTCNILVILSGVAIPSVLISAALFVKMLRVYTIFMNPYSYKQKFFSDAFLFLYISLIILPTVLILIIWMSLGPFKNVSVKFPQKNHLLLLERCETKHTAIWIGLLFLYSFFVIMALAILAFKSSKIRYKNFRDTKATNAFAFLYIFSAILGLMYWFFYRTLEQSFSTLVKINIPLYITHFTLPLLCQMFLFVPKVYPPIKRHLTKNSVKSKGLSK